MHFDPALLALTPRQVVLSNSTMKTAKPLNLSSDQKSSLLRSVARFLELNDFSKTLKRFLSEADIQIDVLKGSMDLEEIYIKYIEMCDEAETKKKEQDKTVVCDEDVKKLEQQQLEEPDENEKEKNKNKKRKKKNLSSEPESLPDATEEKSKEVNAEKKLSSDYVEQKPEESKKNEKKKKKKNDLSSEPKLVSEAFKEKSKDANVEKKVTSDNVETLLEKEKSSKSKCKKKKTDDSDGTSGNGNSNATDEDSKGSKKRKREVPNECDSKPAEKIVTEESKRRKVTKAIENQINGSENGNMDKSTENSAVRKSGKKQLNGSAEPKTVNAFQRVKVDEVVFTDERLKDNSYWAKSGAESGYGAKAEEVLGQVRGRDFRHEKTKKKRGSYRGGQIDLQSHSVKFNYSDDE